MNKTIIAIAGLVSLTAMSCMCIKTYETLRVANIEKVAKLAAYSCNSYGVDIVVCPTPMEKDANYAN